MIVMRTFV